MDGPLRRTELGNRTLQEREAGKRLPARLRSLLLQVDGERTGLALKALAASLGMPDDSLAELVSRQLIEPASGESGVTVAPVDHEQPDAVVAAEITDNPPIETPAAPMSEREALMAALSVSISETRLLVPAPVLASPAATDNPAEADLPPRIRNARDKMLGVAAMIAGLPGLDMRQQIRECRDVETLHAAYAKLRLVMRHGYRGDDVDRILDPIKRMLPQLPASET
ncbi:hypothetical protein [Chitinimonas naiadis]